MILNELFESRMSELDIEYQDWKNMEPVAFYSRYKISKDEWARRHWSLIKGDQTVHEQAIAEGEVYDLEKEYGYEKPKTKPKVPSSSTPPTRIHPDDTDFMDPVERRLRADQARVKDAWATHNAKKGVAEDQIDEKQDACYRKVKSRYKVWPSAYASGALVQCRKKGAANWGNKSKK